MLLYLNVAVKRVFGCQNRLMEKGESEAEWRHSIIVKAGESNYNIKKGKNSLIPRKGNRQGKGGEAKVKIIIYGTVPSGEVG